MKIIKEGKTKEELNQILNHTKRFKCKTCGCVFEADESEYKMEQDNIYSHFYSKCPNCNMRAFEIKMR